MVSSYIKQYFFLHCCLLLSISFLVSCEDCTFTSKNSTFIKVRFYRQNGKNDGRDRITRFIIDSVRTERGTLYRRPVSNLTGIDTLSLPINPTDNNSSYYVFFRRNNFTDNIQFRDTLQVSYNRIFSVIAPNCGYDQKVDELAISPNKTTIQSAFVFKNSLNINDTLNIRIFF